MRATVIARELRLRRFILDNSQRIYWRVRRDEQKLSGAGAAAAAATTEKERGKNIGF